MVTYVCSLCSFFNAMIFAPLVMQLHVIPFRPFITPMYVTIFIIYSPQVCSNREY